MAAKLPVQSFRLKNFKAIRDSGTVRFSPLTVFIGNNGVGKSSLIEGLETFQTIVTDGADEALRPWLGLEHILHQGSRHDRRVTRGRSTTENPLQFMLNGWLGHQPARAEMSVGFRDGKDEIWIERERYKARNEEPYIRDGDVLSRKLPTQVTRIEDDESILSQLRDVVTSIARWQFVLLDPAEMGYPRSMKRTRRNVRLARDGSNVAEYLLDIRSRDVGAYDSIVDVFRYVLPYARDVQPNITREIERAAYLQMTEKTYKVPGWLLSTGTLRVLALLALLRDPDPPPLIVVEEIENGLDPRTIHLIVQEIRDAIARNHAQFIATTHSPYLLDLLALDDLVLVEREDGDTVFRRIEAEEGLKAWADRFAPGKLYTMGQLSRYAR